MNATELALSGPLALAALVAVAAGALSFASPCALPLVPGYLAYLAGVAGTRPVPASVNGPGGDPQDEPFPASARWRMAGAAALFVGGFTVVFTAGVLLVLGLTDLLLEQELLLQRIGGVVTILMGLTSSGRSRLSSVTPVDCGRDAAAVWSARRFSERCTGWAGHRASVRR